MLYDDHTQPAGNILIFILGCLRSNVRDASRITINVTIDQFPTPRLQVRVLSGALFRTEYTRHASLSL